MIWLRVLVTFLARVRVRVRLWVRSQEALVGEPTAVQLSP